MTRYRAAALHFGLSVLVVGTVFLVVYLLWYPPPLFEGAGGRDLFLVLALVDVTIGPLITMIIFRAGKPGLKFDLATIAVLQVAALSYGTWVVHEARPVWVVFLKDRFDLIRANQVLDEERARAKPEFQVLSHTGPRIAGARVPTNPDDQFRTMITALSGIDVSSYPQFFVPYDEIRAEAAAKAKPVGELRSLNKDAPAKVEAAIAATGRREAELAFLPLRAGKRDLAVIIDAHTGEVLRLAALKPWRY